MPQFINVIQKINELQALVWLETNKKINTNRIY